MTAAVPSVYRGGDNLVEVIRSGFAESFHRGSVVVVDPAGDVVTAIGDVNSPVFPRSAIKPVLAVAMLRAGWCPSDAAQLATAAASHRGEPMHVEQVEAILSSASLREDALQCPLDLPADPAAREAVITAGGRPRRTYMTCSGKHAAMLATCVANGWDTATYQQLDHPLQVHARTTVEDLSGESVAATGVDGCGVPIFAVSLAGLARASVSLVETRGGVHARAVADAMRAFPRLVEGTDQSDSRAMGAVPGLLSKMGAEGIQLLAAPGAGAVAVKIDDGAGRASMPVALRAFSRLSVPETAEAVMREMAAPRLWGGGAPVGSLRTLI